MAPNDNFDTIHEMKKVNPLRVQSGFTWVHPGASIVVVCSDAIGS